MMKRLIAVLLVWAQVALPGVGWGATYTVCPSGCTATSISAVISGTDLNGGDVVEVRAGAQGGTIILTESVAIAVADSGASNESRVLFECRDGDTCIIDGTTNAGVIRPTADNTQYITFKDFQLVGGTNSNFYSLYSTTGISLQNITYRGPVRAINVGGTSKVTASLEIDGAALVGNFSSTAILLGGTTPTFTSPSLSNIDGSQAVISGHGLQILSATDPILSSINLIETGLNCVELSNISGAATSGNNITVADCGAAGFDMTAITAGNFTNLTIDGTGGGAGLFIDNSHGLQFTYLSASNATGAGARIANGSYDIVLDLPVTAYNLDGISTENSHDITINYPISRYNGDVSGVAQDSGDGITSHGTDYNINVKYPIIYENLNTALAFTGNSAGSVYNGTFFNNGDPLFLSRAGIYLNLVGVNPTTGSSWTIKNNVNVDSYRMDAEFSVAAAALLGTSLILDNNRYWSSIDNAGRISLDLGNTTIAWAAYQSSEPNSLFTDPLLDSTGRPAATSPAINAGALIAGIHDQATPATDIAGTPVLTVPDIGAYEYPGGLHFNSSAADGGNGTRALPYNAWTDYTWTGYNLRAGAEIYLQGAMAGTLDLSGLTDTGAILVKPWPGKKKQTINGFIPNGTETTLQAGPTFLPMANIPP